MIKRYQRGQAMSEFVISATYVLIPLFIAIPMLAKYIDIKHASVQAARYEAWEYTVWYEDENNDDNDILDNYDSGLSGYLTPEKDLDTVRNESQRRFYSRVGTNPTTGADNDVDPLTIADIGGWNAATANPLWTNHRELPMFTGDIQHDAITETSADTPTLSITIAGVELDLGSIVTTLLDLASIGFDLVGDALGVLGSDAGFSAINTDGYSRVQMNTRIWALTDREGDLEIAHVRDRLQDDELTGASARTVDFLSKASVLSDGWGAGGTDHTYLQVNGATPSILVKEILDLPVLDQVWDIISFIAPELSECTNADDPSPPIVTSPFAGPEGNLWLGYVDGDVVHPDRLSVIGESSDDRLGGHVCDDSGRCVWDDTVQGLEDAGMNPLSHSPCIP
ncbi:MAG: hypothetical protein AAF387_17880 [Pseudomonadota bacterium]